MFVNQPFAPNKATSPNECEIDGINIGAPKITAKKFFPRRFVRSKLHAAASPSVIEIIVATNAVDTEFQTAAENCGELTTCAKPSGVIRQNSEPSGANTPTKKIIVTVTRKSLLIVKTCAVNQFWFEDCRQRTFEHNHLRATK